MQVPVGNPFSSTASMDFSDGQQPAAASQPSVDESTDDEDESLIAVEATKVRALTLLACCVVLWWRRAGG